MGINVYYPQDIRNALLAAEQASNAALMAVNTEDDPFARGYREGYRAALTTVALAFGLIRSDSHQEDSGWQPTLLMADPLRGRRNGH